MNIEFIELIGVSLIGSFIALAGGLVFLYNKTLSDALSKNSIPFAAGVLITVALIGLLPEASIEIGEEAFVWVLGSFLVMYLFEHLIFGLHHHTDDCKHHHGHDSTQHHATVPMVIFGDSIHNFIDGVAIGASFLINPGLGLVTAVSTFLHEVPHEIGDFGILLKAGWKKSKIILINLFSASLTIVGAVTIYYLPISHYTIAVLMSISAGIFLYLGATDFLPQVEEIKQNKIKSLIPLLLGVAIMYGTLKAIPHSHGDEDVHEEVQVEDIHNDEDDPETEELHNEQYEIIINKNMI